jgi:hypothetical protein
MSGGAAISRLEIHVETIVLDGLPADELDAVLRRTEHALSDLLAGRTPVRDRNESTGALANAIADAVHDVLRTLA